MTQEILPKRRDGKTREEIQAFIAGVTYRAPTPPTSRIPEVLR